MLKKAKSDLLLAGFESLPINQQNRNDFVNFLKLYKLKSLSFDREQLKSPTGITFSLLKEYF